MLAKRVKIERAKDRMEQAAVDLQYYVKNRNWASNDSWIVRDLFRYARAYSKAVDRLTRVR